MVVIASAVFDMEMAKERVAEFPAESVTVTFTLTDREAEVAAERTEACGSITAAWACGVPEIVRVVVSALTDVVNPFGRPVTDQVKGALPPAAVIGQE